MFIILAVVCFLLAFFGATIDGKSFMLLGLAFFAAHFVFDWAIPFRRRPPQ